jgi:hypothetical protein
MEAQVYTFWISIDSADVAVHERMRGLPGVIKGIERALPIFHAQGFYPSDNLGITRNVGGTDAPDGSDLGQLYDYFRTSFRRFYTRAIELGFTIANSCYPMSVNATDRQGLDAVYQASADDAIVRFSGPEKAQIFRALYETIPEFRQKIRIFSPRTSLRTLLRQYGQQQHPAYPCRGGKDYFFVDARDGDTYPCGYRGEGKLGRFWEMDLAADTTKADCTQCDWECFRDPSEIRYGAESLYRAS